MAVNASKKEAVSLIFNYPKSKIQGETRME